MESLTPNDEILVIGNPETGQKTFLIWLIGSSEGTLLAHCVAEKVGI